jgi:hypothetical protein
MQLLLKFWPKILDSIPYYTVLNKINSLSAISLYASTI